MSLIEIGIVTCELLTNAAFRGSLFTFTTAPMTKFEPFTASVKAVPPATTLDGLRDEIAGGGRKTLNAMLVEGPPPGAGFKTVIPKAPAGATSPAKIAALRCVELANVVGLAIAPNKTLAPLTKFVPFTESAQLPLPSC